MRLILHVGMPKAGSTALQRGLKQLQGRLLEQGYLYPTSKRPFHNHNFLAAAMVPPERLPRYFLPRYRERPDRVVARDFEKWIGGIAAQGARHRPRTLILSGESLFNRASPERCAKLAAALRPLVDEIEVVAYLRKPSDFYLAATQQILKADHRIKALAPVEYRVPLEGFATIADRMHVFKYDRALFPGGDLMRHFLQTFCPEVSAEDMPRADANVSLSAEALSILMAYRRRHHSDKPRRFTKDSALLHAALSKADGELPKRRSRLREDLARTIDEGSVDLLWLRDAWGIVFDGIDYARIAPMASHRRPQRIEEICELDKARESEAALHAFRHLADELARLRKAGARRGRRGLGRGRPRSKLGKAAVKRAVARAGWLRSVLRPLVGAPRP